MTDDFVLEARGITKHFNGVTALDGVQLQLKRGEILGLVGDNGAGKSTLIKIISGLIQPDTGQIYIDGEKVHITSPRDAEELGIETVYQELALVDYQNVPFNVFLGRELNRKGLLGKIGILDDKRMVRESQRLLDQLHVSLGSLKRPMSEYSGGQRQSVAICKVVYWGKKIAILDEPTAALGVRESARVLEFILSLKEHSNLSVIIIAHNMQHIFHVCDRIQVLRRGKYVTVQDTDKVSINDIVKYITGLDE